MIHIASCRQACIVAYTLIDLFVLHSRSPAGVHAARRQGVRRGQDGDGAHRVLRRGQPAAGRIPLDLQQLGRGQAGTTDRQTDLTTETLILTSESQKARSTKNPRFIVDVSNIIIQSG